LAAFAVVQGKIIITMDADLQNHPEEIPKLIAKIEEGYDVVGGLRQEQLNNDHAFSNIQSKIINIITRKATGVILHDYGCMLRAYLLEVTDVILLCKERCC
jgi:undecaprenyl-phosphate 4-deoxy-4-formamido-L-arabinose transferase